jgi:hypothetical protein
MIDEVDDLELRARAARVPLARVVHRAGIAYSTWTRWKNNDTSPGLKRIKAMRQALDELITERWK